MQLVIEPEELEAHLDDPEVVIIDLCKETQYKQAHIPNAHYLPYPGIVRIEKPTMGLLPDDTTFAKLLSSLGISEDKHIVAYDDEGGGCAARLIWTLHVFGHDRTSLLNGGLHSWANEGHPLSLDFPMRSVSDYNPLNTGKHTADREYIREHLDDPNVSLLDARTPQEYQGEKKFAEKAGHIPGAIHFEWTDAMNRSNNLRLLPEAILLQRLEETGLTPDKEIICYCQSHHRSAFSYVMLKSLGYENVKGYPGSWSDWGNHPDTPVE